MILRSLFLAWGDLFRPRIFSVVLLGIGLTILLFLGLQAAIFFAIRNFAPETLSLPLIGEIALASALSWGSLALLPLMGFFLMAPVAAGFAGLFADQVADAVERVHYPQAVGRSVGFIDGLLELLPIFAAIIGVGILTLIASPFLGPFAPVLFYGANGWLLGREFYQTTARRHMPEAEATAIRQQNGGQATGLGILIALLLTVPLLNILVPVLTAAGFTHLFHLTGGTSGQRLRHPHG